MFQLALTHGLQLTAKATDVAEVHDEAGNVIAPASVISTITIDNADGTTALMLEPTWSQAVFNHDFHSWLLALVKKINDFLSAFLAEVEGPVDQAALEAALAAKLSFDPATNQVVIK